MPIGEGLYAHFEIEFRRSHKWITLPPGARELYSTLWCLALEQRREIIERPPLHYLASIAGLPRHPIASYLQSLHDRHLTYMNDCYIAMIGLRKKHSKIKFKDEFENTGIEFEYSQDRSFLSFPFLSFPSLTISTLSKDKVADDTQKDKPKPKRKRSSKDKELPDPNVKIFIEWWSEQFIKIVGDNAIINFGRDGKGTKEALRLIPIEDLQSRAVRFLNDPKSWPAGDKSLTNFLQSRTLSRYGTNFDLNGMDETTRHNLAVVAEIEREEKSKNGDK